jgi:hypothetical protein
MKRGVYSSVMVGAACGLVAMLGCSKEAPAPVSMAGGKDVRPGDRAIQRNVPYLFTLIRLEERDRVFGMMNRENEPILTSLKQLDDARKRLIDMLNQTAHVDLASVLAQKRITCIPDNVDIVLGAPEVLEYKREPQDAQTPEIAEVKVKVTAPGGKSKQAWVRMKREGMSWRLTMPLADSPAAGPSKALVEQVRGEVDKAVSGLKKVMTDLADRLEAGEMMEDAPMRQKLTEAGRPLVTALQKIIYGQS